MRAAAGVMRNAFLEIRVPAARHSPHEGDALAQIGMIADACHNLPVLSADA